MKLVARIFNGVIDGDVFQVSDDAVLGPECVPVTVDAKPAFDSATQKVERGPNVVENGGTSVRVTWQVVALNAAELAEIAEKAQILSISNAINGALAKLDAGTATTAEMRNYLAQVLRFIQRLIKTQGLP